MAEKYRKCLLKTEYKNTLLTRKKQHTNIFSRRLHFCKLVLVTCLSENPDEVRGMKNFINQGEHGGNDFTKSDNSPVAKLVNLFEYKSNHPIQQENILLSFKFLKLLKLSERFDRVS